MPIPRAPESIFRCAPARLGNADIGAAAAQIAAHRLAHPLGSSPAWPSRIRPMALMICPGCRTALKPVMRDKGRCTGCSVSRRPPSIVSTAEHHGSAPASAGIHRPPSTARCTPALSGHTPFSFREIQPLAQQISRYAGRRRYIPPDSIDRERNREIIRILHRHHGCDEIRRHPPPYKWWRQKGSRSFLKKRTKNFCSLASVAWLARTSVTKSFASFFRKKILLQHFRIIEKPPLEPAPKANVAPI